MIRLFPALASVAASTLLVVAASDANAQAAHYVAVPEAAAPKANVITRSTAWSLRGDRYVANRAPERDAILCQLLARDVGPLRSFSSGGAALDADALGKCNAKARKVAGAAVATAAR